MGYSGVNCEIILTCIILRIFGQGIVDRQGLEDLK
jgi:hypothetical protein